MSRGLGKEQRRIVEFLKGGRVASMEDLYRALHPGRRATPKGMRPLYRAMDSLERRGLVAVFLEVWKRDGGLGAWVGWRVEPKLWFCVEGSMGFTKEHILNLPKRRRNMSWGGALVRTGNREWRITWEGAARLRVGPRVEGGGRSRFRIEVHRPVPRAQTNLPGPWGHG